MRRAGLYWLLVVMLALAWSRALTEETARGKSATQVPEELVFHSDKELAEHLQSMNARYDEKAQSRSKPGKGDSNGNGLSENEMAALRKDLLQARLSLKDIKDVHGKVSTQYAHALHKVGRILHKLRRFDEALEVANDIVRVHEKLDGVEHLNTANALSNVGAAAFQLNRKQDCQWAMERALFILIQIYGANSNEVLLHRGRMLTYQVPNAKTSGGISYEDYTYEL